MQKIDELKACVQLQFLFDTISDEQKWMKSELRGLKGLYKKWFFSRWNSEIALMGCGLGLGGAFGILDLVAGTLHSVQILQLLATVSMTPIGLTFMVKNIQRNQMVGPDEQLGKSECHCDIHIVEALMRAFERRHSDVATPFIKQFESLKNNGLTVYQAYRIAKRLDNEFKITEKTVLHDLTVGVYVAEPDDVYVVSRPSANTLKL